MCCGQVGVSLVVFNREIRDIFLSVSYTATQDCFQLAKVKEGVKEDA